MANSTASTDIPASGGREGGLLSKERIIAKPGFNRCLRKTASCSSTVKTARASRSAFAWRVRAGSNNAYAKRMEARVKPYRRQIQNETMESALVERIVKEVYAETVVLGWENVEDENGNQGWVKNADLEPLP